MKSGLWHKELLNFDKPLPLDITMLLDNEKNMGEWSFARAVNEGKIWYESNTNITFSKRFQKVHVLKKHLQDNFTVTS